VFHDRSVFSRTELGSLANPGAYEDAHLEQVMILNRELQEIVGGKPRVLSAIRIHGPRRDVKRPTVRRGGNTGFVFVPGEN
jgi:hypothetical protein